MAEPRSSSSRKLPRSLPKIITSINSKRHDRFKSITSVKTVEGDGSEAECTVPSKDTGRGATITMLAILLLDSSTYGFVLAYGVFQEHYRTQFSDHTIASWIGVLSGGLPFLGAPAITWCCQRYAFPRQYYLCIGFALCLLSLLASAFLNTLPGLIVMQGFVYGIGALLVGIPELIILNTWFDKRRGIAYGIVFAGADLFGVAYTFLATELLNNYSLRTTLLIFCGITLAVGGPPLLFIRERIDPSAIENATLSSGASKPRRGSNMSHNSLSQPANADMMPFSPSLERGPTWPKAQPRKRFYQRSIFYLFTIINVLQSSAFYLPFIYLPSFVVELGHSKRWAATVLAVANFAMIIGDLGFGKLSDILPINLLIIASTATSAVSTFVLWGFVGSNLNNLAAMIAFAALFGVFGGGFVALWARMGTVFGERDAQMVYSTLCFGRGVGGIISGPISQILLKTGPPKTLQTLGKGPYAGIIMFVGMCTAGAAIMGGGAILALWWKKEQAMAVTEKERVLSMAMNRRVLDDLEVQQQKKEMNVEVESVTNTDDLNDHFTTTIHGNSNGKENTLGDMKHDILKFCMLNK